MTNCPICGRVVKSRWLYEGATELVAVCDCGWAGFETDLVKPRKGNPMKKLLSYLTGAVALLVVAMTIVAALIYAATHGLATLSNLATSALSGVGVAIGSCLGAALVMRFQAARRFVSNTLKEIKR